MNIFAVVLKLLLLSSSVLSFSPSSDDEEEILVSEEEVPFKDDPRDETYKPHLEKYVKLPPYCL